MPHALRRVIPCRCRPQCLVFTNTDPLSLLDTRHPMLSCSLNPTVISAILKNIPASLLDTGPVRAVLPLLRADGRDGPEGTGGRRGPCPLPVFGEESVGDPRHTFHGACPSALWHTCRILSKGFPPPSFTSARGRDVVVETIQACTPSLEDLHGRP